MYYNINRSVLETKTTANGYVTHNYAESFIIIQSSIVRLTFRKEQRKIIKEAGENNIS